MSHDAPSPSTQRLAIDAVRVLSMDAVQQANSGHPGTPMALAPLGYVTWNEFLKHNPANPEWWNRDRFVLSVGHASMLLYSMLYLSGYDLSLQDIKDFRQWGSKTPGHPEFGHTAGVETTTGPLGQGVATSVGMAMAERALAARFNRDGHNIVDHHTWVFCSDGDLMEGISHEAGALAGHHRLGKLIWVFDDNDITIDGGTSLSTSVDQCARFESYGWHTQRVEDGEDLDALRGALQAARDETDRPSLIALKTIIGFGSPAKAGSSSAHGAPLGADEVAATKSNLSYPTDEPFWVADEALAHWREAEARGRTAESEWQTDWEAYRVAHPDLAAELASCLGGAPPAGWADGLPDLLDLEKGEATRASSGKVLQGVAAALPSLMGGSADLAGSNKTLIAGADSYLPNTPSGRNMFFGIREHAMAAVMNGMALHGGIRPYGGTFLIFSDYMRPAIRLAALQGVPALYVFTHDSIGLGEDGPTHQPIEQLATLRAIPGLMDLRPCDGPETAVAWRMAMERTDGPAFLSLTRQSVPLLPRKRSSDGDGVASAEGLARGGYVLWESEASNEPDVILIASGSEVNLALDAGRALAGDGHTVRVVSLPSWFLFSRQEQSYRDSVLPPSVRTRVSIEAGSTMGWRRWTTSDGAPIGIDHFGASAPAEELYERFEITAERIVQSARYLLESGQIRVRSAPRTSPLG